MSRDKQGYRAFVRYLGECGLEETLRGIARHHGVSLQEVYSNARGKSIIAARVDMWHWLTSEMGRSPGEIAKMFDRDRGAVSAALKSLRECAEQLALPVTTSTVPTIVRHMVREGRKRGQAA